VISLIDEKGCFEKGLLKKTFPQPDLAKKDIKQAEFFLKESEELLELNKKQIAAISLYNAYFHTARSLLFKEGIKERSHYCIAKYIENHFELEKFVNSFETIMSIRHNVQYSTEIIEIEEDLDELAVICHKFIKEVEKLL
jgi:uncharacterized protein (UPF0332 family)